MEKLVIMLPEDRRYAGTLRLESEDGDVVAGPFPVCGRADEGAALRHGNPSRNPLLPFGDTPLGRYRVEGILPSGAGTERPADRYGPHGVIVLTPTSGDAALADANGRFHLLIQGGAAAPGRQLRPTNGSLRLGNREQKQLIEILRDRQAIICELLPMPGTAGTRPIALGSPCSEGDPPPGVSAAIALPQFGGSGLHSRFPAPTFSLMSEGGGGGAGNGYPDSDEGPAPLPKDTTGANLSKLSSEGFGSPALRGDCNKFLRAVGHAYGVPIPGGNADAILKSISGDKNWQSVSAADAQKLANEGKFVVAGMDSGALHATHGHVAVVVSGTSQKAGDGNFYPMVACGSLGGPTGQSDGSKSAGAVFNMNYRQGIKYRVYNK
jgi:hypothetical protein